MNDGRDLASNQEQEMAAKPPLLALAFAPLLVKTLTVRCKVKPEAYAWLDQAAREVNTLCKC